MILTGEDEVAMLKKILSIITRESNHNPVSRPRVLLIFPADRQEIPLVARTAVSRPWVVNLAGSTVHIEGAMVATKGYLSGWRCGPSWQVNCLQDIGYLVWGTGRPPMK